MAPSSVRDGVPDEHDGRGATLAPHSLSARSAGRSITRRSWFPFTTLVGNIPFPVIPGISEGTGDASGDLHVILVVTTIALLVLHIGAALYQQFVEHDRTAGRMPPQRRMRLIARR